MALFLEGAHNIKLLFGKYLGKAVRFLDRLCNLRRLLMLRIAQTARIKYVRAHSQLFGSFPSDGHIIARDHFDVHAYLFSTCDGCFGIRTGFIE